MRTNVLHRFPEERAALLYFLRALKPAQWDSPTVCPGWSLKDIAAHLVADDFGRLSGERDGYSGWEFAPTSLDTFEAELRDFINCQNEIWVQATRRLSPRVIIDLLEVGGRETQVLFESLDPDAAGLGVSWAGEDVSPNWFDLAREYSERWHHQAQIREAAGAQPLYERRLFQPVIDTMIHAVPHALRDTPAAEGSAIRITVTKQLTSGYDIVRGDNGWELGYAEDEPAGTVTLTADTAWRLLTRNLPRDEIIRRSKVTGDASLATAVFDSMALVA